MTGSAEGINAINTSNTSSYLTLPSQKYKKLSIYLSKYFIDGYHFEKFEIDLEKHQITALCGKHAVNIINLSNGTIVEANGSNYQQKSAPLTPFLVFDINQNIDNLGKAKLNLPKGELNKSLRSKGVFITQIEPANREKSQGIKINTTIESILNSTEKEALTLREIFISIRQEIGVLCEEDNFYSLG